MREDSELVWIVLSKPAPMKPKLEEIWLVWGLPEKFVAPPPAMTAPTAPESTTLNGEPPITFGAPLVFGSKRNARPPFTRNSNDRLSVVPMKFPFAGFASALPPRCQKFELLKPPRVSAFTLLTPAPLPVKPPLKLFAALLNVTALPYGPAVNPPIPTFSAKIADGVGVNF